MVAKVALERLGAAVAFASGCAYLFTHTIPVIPCTLALIALVASRFFNPSIQIKERFDPKEFTDSTRTMRIKNRNIEVSRNMILDINRKIHKLSINGEEIKIEGDREKLAKKVVDKLFAATGNGEKTALLTHFLNQNLNHIIKEKHFCLFEYTNSNKLRFREETSPPFNADQLDEVRIVINTQEETLFAKTSFGVLKEGLLLPNVTIHGEVRFDFLKSEATYTIK